MIEYFHLLPHRMENTMHTATKENGRHHVTEDDRHSSENAELHQLGLMRSFVESRDPSSKEVDDLMLRRFLRARNSDIEKASALLVKYLEWRRTFVPNGFISESEVSNEIAQKKMFCQGYDKEGRPLAVLFGKKHVPNKEKGGLDEFKRFTVYTLDKICSRMPSGQEKFTAIVDVEGWGYSNCDIGAYSEALSILEGCYPERLGKLFLVHVPYIFMTAWKIIYPWIDVNTRRKIVFVDNRELVSSLLQDIDESQLPVVYGGKLPLVSIEES